MPRANAPLTLDRILATAEDVVRRFGPAKATVAAAAQSVAAAHVDELIRLAATVIRRGVEEGAVPHLKANNPLMVIPALGQCDAPKKKENSGR